MVSRRLPAFVLLLLTLSGGTAFAAEFIAEVDRKELYVNEHVLLTLSLSDSDTRLRAEGVSPNIDLTVLSDDFDLGTPQADFRFNIDRGRGRSTSSITLALFPRTPGRARIPSFSADGASTAPIELRVLPLPADSTPEVFARSGILRDRLYVGEQTLLYLDLYHRVDIASARFGGALDSRPRLAIEAHALPVEERSENVSGISYRVTRSAWAVSPVSGEDVTLLLPDIWIETRQGRQWRLPFSEERIDVRPLADDAQTRPAAIGKPQIEMRAPETIVVGEATPWEFVLRSHTALNALPSNAPLHAAADGLRVYMDPPLKRLETVAGAADGAVNDAVESTVVYRGFLLADAAGDYLTPTISLPYYDTASDRVEILEVAGSALRALPAPTLAGNAMALPAAESAPPGAEVRGAHGIWPWLTATLALLWVATLGGWLWQSGIVRARHAVVKPRAAATGSDGDPLQRLLAALDARTLEQGLRNWLTAYGPDDAVENAVRAVQRRRYHPHRADANGDDDVNKAVAEALRCLDGRIVRAETPVPSRDIWSPAAFHPGRTRAP